MRYYLILAVVLASFCACSHGSKESIANDAGDKVLATKQNPKYRLTCVFYGDEISVGDRKAKIVRYLAIRDENTGKEAKYDNVAEGAVMDADSYFTEVWSPDQEYFASLLGRTQGFCIIKASEIMESIKTKKCFDFIRVKLQDGTYLWHQFEKWDNNATLLFKTGLSGDYFSLKYDIVKQVLTNLDSKHQPIEAENSKGKVAILDN